MNQHDFERQKATLRCIIRGEWLRRPDVQFDEIYVRKQRYVAIWFKIWDTEKHRASACECNKRRLSKTFFMDGSICTWLPSVTWLTDPLVYMHFFVLLQYWIYAYIIISSQTKQSGFYLFSFSYILLPISAASDACHNWRLNRETRTRRRWRLALKISPDSLPSTVTSRRGPFGFGQAKGWALGRVMASHVNAFLLASLLSCARGASVHLVFLEKSSAPDSLFWT